MKHAKQKNVVSFLYMLQKQIKKKYFYLREKIATRYANITYDLYYNPSSTDTFYKVFEFFVVNIWSWCSDGRMGWMMSILRKLKTYM